MKQTKKEIALINKLSKYKLLPNQLDPIIKLFRETKDDIIATDQAQRFKDINEGKKVRDFTFVYANGCHKKRGVYKLTFEGSNKFYIGRSKYIETRFKSYWRDFNNFFKINKYPPEHYLAKVFEHLRENQWAYYFEVELLEECYTVDELQEKEQKWLDKFKDNPNCLNIGFIAKKPINEIDETPEQQHERKTNTGIIRRGGRIIFYPKKKKEEDVLHGKLDSVIKHTENKKKIADEFSFNVPEIESTIGHCVYKLYCGDRYVVIAAKGLAGSIFLMQKGYGYFLAYKHKETSITKDYYFAFYDYIRKHPDKTFKVELIFNSDDGFEVLKQSQLYLNSVIKDKKCKNNDLTVYIPKLNSKTGMYNWLTKEQVDTFYKFVSDI